MTTVLDTKASAPAGPKRRSLARPQPISVNGVTIPRDAIARETQNHPATKPVDAWMAAARALVVRELLLQEARRLDLVPAPISDEDGRRETDEEALIRQLVDKEVRVPDPDETALRRVYEARRPSFQSSDLYAVRHILLAAAPDDPAGRDRAKTEALSIIAALEAAPSQFAEIAAARSACPSRSQGGALGQVSRGQTVAEFETALATAPVGRVIPTPVETRFGHHVVIVDQRIEGRQLPFDVVRDRIAQWLADRARVTSIRQYIAMLAGRARIVGIAFDVDATGLSVSGS
jgi:peptidyl-prolyl cis-trans isomerase C